MTASLTIQQTAEACGLSVHTLRYYERIGLIKPIPRRSNGHRLYRAEDLNWIAFLLRLRATGMSIGEMQRYAQLREQGDLPASALLDGCAKSPSCQAWRQPASSPMAASRWGVPSAPHWK